MGKNKLTFEEIFEQNERRIHYHIHRLNIHDTHHEFYQEGLCAMWNAYEKYQPDKGPLATYFNFMIRSRMIDLIRRKNRERAKTDRLIKEKTEQFLDGNHYRNSGNFYPLVRTSEDYADMEAILRDAKDYLSGNQWKWVKYFIIEDMPVKEIAEQEDVSVDAVKSWGREARRKLQAEHRHNQSETT